MKCYRYIGVFIWLTVNFVYANEVVNISTSSIEFKSLLKVGDWIFRKGIQVDSLMVNQFGGGEYSHIGMIVSVKPEIKIIHATTNDNELYPNQVILSTFTEFTLTELAEKYAIVRPNFLTDEQKYHIANDLLKKQGETFILASREQEHLYCTTLLFDTIIKYQPDFALEWQQTNFPLFSGVYLFPNAFINHSDVSWIYKYPEEH